jgi:1-deoxy-D-xylulose-5-phosphate reductoisomerase
MTRWGKMVLIKSKEMNLRFPISDWRKNIAILGSTGSIGENALNIVRDHPDRFCVKALAAKKNAELLLAQAREFRPEAVCLFDATYAKEIEAPLKKLGIRFFTGEEGLIEISTHKSVDQVLFAVVGAVGLKPIFAAIQASKEVAVANKEPLVIAGEILMREARARNIRICPVDSEHSGVWQCLEGRSANSIKKVILTSSGGPFRMRKGSLAKVKVSEALKHPKWKMGPKITIDSATLMNKGLEVIEAANLFEMPADKIEVLIHPEAIIHAMVEFVDGSLLAHMGVTDMRLPIQYALSYPERLVNHLPTLDFAAIRSLNFQKPDRRRFPCLELGYEASRLGGTMPAILNAANEIAVEAFLIKKIPFLKIPKVIEKAMRNHRLINNPSLSDLLDADAWAREDAKRFIK